METKYYTPEMEEFHIRFEYELMKPDSKYHKRIFGEDKIDNPELNQFSDELMKIAHAITRVKHLDREDIESFGFIHVAKDWWHKSNIGDDWQILKTKEHTYHISFGQHEFSKTYFHGQLKNKSELKRLLHQLKIL